jgi:hypothetical protein
MTAQCEAHCALRKHCEKRKKRTRTTSGLPIDADYIGGSLIVGKLHPYTALHSCFPSISFIEPSRESKYCYSFHLCCRHGRLYTCAFVACCCFPPERWLQCSGADWSVMQWYVQREVSRHNSVEPRWPLGYLQPLNES